MDLYKHEVTINNEPVQLTLAEFKLLHQLVSKPGCVFTRDRLLDAVSRGPGNVCHYRTVDVHIVSLREKVKGTTRAVLLRSVESDINLRNTFLAANPFHDAEGRKPPFECHPEYRKGNRFHRKGRLFIIQDDFGNTNKTGKNQRLFDGTGNKKR